MKKRLEILFIIIILVSLGILGNNFYRSYSFKNSDIPQSYKERIKNKELEVLRHMRSAYGIAFKFPLEVTDKFRGRLYGVTSYDKGEIKIYLNKKVMRESMDYMIDSVIAHEYAHALMFKMGHIDTASDGHSKEWREVCVNLGGNDCQQYVDREEIIMSKMPFN